MVFSESCLLVCGDDKGTLWVYDIYDYVSGCIPNPLTGGPKLDSALEPSCKLAWPELDDAEVSCILFYFYLFIDLFI